LHSANRARRGLTLIETVAASVLLALMASTLLGGMTMMLRAQSRQQQKLAATELCNRLILQYLDDAASMPDSNLPIAYANERYRWELAKTPARMVDAKAEVAAARADKGGLVLDRLELITVRVWLSEESGGAFRPDAGTPVSTLARIVDPVADIYRNPDSASYLMSTPEGRKKLLERFAGTESGGLVNRSIRREGNQRPTRDARDQSLKEGQSGGKDGSGSGGGGK
jgi:type II secretory pathway pseudopilin PulG